MPEPTVRIKGLRELRRDLRAIDRALPREISKVTREATQPIASRARELWNSRPGLRTGRGQHLGPTIRPFTSGTRIGIRSDHPAAGWLSYGGTIRPRGVDITRTRQSPGALFIHRAVEDEMPRFVDSLDRGFDALSQRHGWR